jgi:hypothetical protein
VKDVDAPHPKIGLDCFGFAELDLPPQSASNIVVRNTENTVQNFHTFAIVDRWPPNSSIL